MYYAGLIVVNYYRDGKLLKWLESGYCDDEAEKIRELNSEYMPSDYVSGKSICDILGTEYKYNVPDSLITINNLRTQYKATV